MALTTRTPSYTWVGRDAQLYMDKAVNINFTTSASLSGAFALSGIAVAAACKNVTVTPPETSWEKQDLMGQDGSGFQNMLLDEKPVGTATVTGTLVLGDDETVSDYTVSGSTAVTAGDTYTRYQLGDDGRTLQKVAACVSLLSTDNVSEANFAFDNARFTKLGDVRVSGPDAHFEQDFTIVCLPKDYRWEFKD